jgi:hypothetical protein
LKWGLSDMGAMPAAPGRHRHAKPRPWHPTPTSSVAQALGFLLPLLVLAAGCGGSAGQFVPVAGKVTFRGKPLAAGTIVFAPDPDRGTTAIPVCAEIQSDGMYRLKPSDAPGIAPGWYRVTVAAVEIVPAQGTSPAVPRSLLPDRYRDPELSGLICEVKPGRENSINFNLE